nr:MAG TPA: hypothetical protein [Caudoviricetes sp.]
MHTASIVNRGVALSTKKPTRRRLAIARGSQQRACCTGWQPSSACNCRL